jgi:hypothetical protein
MADLKSSPEVEKTLAGMSHLTDAQKETIRKAVAKEKAGKGRRISKETIEGKYAHVVKDSLRWDEAAGKQQVTIVCTHSGCSTKRDVYTSDLFQVKVCLDHRAAAKKAKKDADKVAFEDFKKQRAAEATTTAEPEAEAEPEGEAEVEE